MVGYCGISFENTLSGFKRSKFKLSVCWEKDFIAQNGKRDGQVDDHGHAGPYLLKLQYLRELEMKVEQSPENLLVARISSPLKGRN